MGISKFKIFYICLFLSISVYLKAISKISIFVYLYTFVIIYVNQGRIVNFSKLNAVSLKSRACRTLIYTYINIIYIYIYIIYLPLTSFLSFFNVYAAFIFCRKCVFREWMHIVKCTVLKGMLWPFMRFICTLKRKFWRALLLLFKDRFVDD